MRALFLCPNSNQTVSGSTGELDMNDEIQPQRPSRRKIDFSRIGNKILVLLNQKYLESKKFYVPFNEIAASIPSEPRNAVWDELRQLIEQNKVTQNTETKVSNPFSAIAGLAQANKVGTYEVGVDGYTITRVGIAEVNRLTDEAYEILADEIVAPDADAPKSEPDKWEPLPIDKGSTEFSKAVEATEIALKEIEGSNGFADSNLLQRNSIVETIKSNLKNLKEGLISKGQLLEGLIKPLRSVAAIFVNGAVGELAKRAVNFLLKLYSGS